MHVIFKIFYNSVLFGSYVNFIGVHYFTVCKMMQLADSIKLIAKKNSRNIIYT